MIEKSTLNESQILFILRQVIQGIDHMHQLGIAHRDIKVENILLHEKNFKLCDFGSASDKRFDPKSEHEKEEMFEDFEKFTTFMYRPPEMIDRFRGYDVNL